MSNVTVIPIANLAIGFFPVLFILFIFVKWNLDWKSLAYASVRMLVQLALIGYVLTFIFSQSQPWFTLIILIGMFSISAWISLYSIKEHRRQFFKYSLLSLVLGAAPVLLLVCGLVIPTSPWYQPSFIIPLAGMIFANSMNTVSLAAERFESSKDKKAAYKASLIPSINSFMAVGLVSLPGMMTGQILSGVDPLIAVRYQIVVMTMILGAGGLSAAIYLQFRSRLQKTE